MSIQHLVSPTAGEEKLNIDCNTVVSNQLITNTVQTGGLISGAVSTNIITVNTITANKLTVVDNVMVFNATKAQAKIVGYLNWLFTDGQIFKSVTSQDTSTHFVKRYKYVFNWNCISDFTTCAITFQIEDGDVGSTLTGIDTKFDAFSIGNNLMYYGVMSQAPPLLSNQVSASWLFSPVLGSGQTGTVYVEFYLVKPKY